MLLAGSLFVASPLAVEANGALGARILDAMYTGKIYDGQVENLNFTVLNLGRTDTSGASLFFIKVQADGAVVHDESMSPWKCDPGAKVTRSIQLSNLEGPDEYSIRAELFWKNQTALVLEDVREFRVLVVKLYTTDWSQSISTVQIGARIPSTLTVSFQNGGNDKMFSTSISATDVSGLQVTTKTRDIGDVPAEETARADFAVSATSSASMGPHVLTFEVSYADFRGTLHVEKASVTLTVTKLGASLDLNVMEKIKYGYPIQAEVRLADANGDPIKDQTVRFYLIHESEETEIGSNMTDSSGYVRITYDQILDAGDYQLKAYYEGSASHSPTSMTTRVTITPIPTSLSLSLPGSTVVGRTVNITIHLKDELDNPVMGQVVEFFADSEKVGSSITDSNGMASTLYVPGKKGTVQFGIKYEGGGNFVGTEWTGTLSVEAIQTTLTLFVQGFALQGDDIVMKARIRDTAGTPIRDATLNFTVVAGGSRIDQAVMTDSEGSASVPFKVITTGTISVDVVYAGDMRYEGNRATASMTVFHPLFVGGVVAAVVIACLLGVLGFIMFRLKRNPFAHMRERIAKPQPEMLQRKPVPQEIVPEALGQCPNCSYPMSETETFCQKCGAQREPTTTGQSLDDKVYSYIVEHSGVISLKQAAGDLGITPQELKEVTERLKQQGRLA